ncbi:MAG: hypothetical protein RL291_2025 [Pseudomonadota bacterium]
MVVLNRIYTRTGDKGTTALGTGQRVEKFNLRIESYGTVDETNSVLGVVRIALQTAKRPPDGLDVDRMINRIQNDLFDLGADLCVPDRGEKLAYEPLRITPSQVKRLEDEIDAMNDTLAPLRSFVLPGGTAAAAHLHVARTVCRRAERLVVELAAKPDEPVSDAAVQYLNRLSDHLFVASRYVNSWESGDVLWVPGQNR